MRSAAGRVVCFVLVAVLVMSAVGFAASQTFINKTGKTVIGIKVEFSKSVRITRHDSVFPDQDPSGHAQEFTFSGGELHNSGRFSITWLPSSGKVTDYEWIEKAQPAQTQQTTSSSVKQGSSLPDPNTPPILYGDDYPGPDEPLYQPAADEQIWLTDLDGHADIYDNDGIKINYAPGFDKSQITKIDVYRNGIKLRFLPDTFDVLTNAQMKTFDGNRLERSPASNHTDHAIMGYEYKFKIQTADHLWMVSKTVKSGLRWHPKEVYAYIDWDWNYVTKQNGFTHDDLVKFFTKLKADGFTGINFDMAYYVNSPQDNIVFELHDRYSGVMFDTITTPSLSELENMLSAIDEAGLNAHVRGQIYISQRYQDEHGPTFGGMVDPSNPQRFFDNYTDLWLQVVPLLNKYHVKLITPFVEMDKIEKYPDLIKRMYTRIGQAYGGEMGLDEATNVMLMGASTINDTPIHTVNAFGKLVKNFTFWDWTNSQRDPMSIEYSGWTPPLETQKDQRVSVMTRNFIEFWKLAVDYYKPTYSNNPMGLGEIGTRDADGQSLGLKYYDIPSSERRYDEQEMADFFYATLKGSQELGFDFLNIWYFPLCEWDRNVPSWHAPGLWILNIGYNFPEMAPYRVIKAIIKPDASSE